jgi:DNA-binding transcriptional MerR regulator
MELTAHASDRPTPVHEAGDNPAALIVAAVEGALELAQTWLGWDGRPRVDQGGRRLYTPHKAIRRTGDHIVDHLAEVEALLAGQPTEEDRWFASTVTVAADWAPFTEADLAEAEQRLRRLARTFELRYAAAGPEEWDRPRDPNWTLRQIAEHVGTAWYAEQVGNLDAE